MSEIITFKDKVIQSDLIVGNVRSKNSFNKDNVITNLFPNDNVFGNATGEYIFYAPCRPNTVYSIQRISTNTSGLIICCSASIPAQGVATINVQNFGNISKKENYVTPSNAKYLCVRINPSGGTATLEEIKNSFQIEQGTQATNYSPNIPFENLNDTGWINIPLGGTVSNYESGFPPLRCRRIGKAVFVKGMVNGTYSASAFTSIGSIPVSFRPKYTEYFIIDNNGSFKDGIIETTGDIKIYNGTNGWIKIDCWYFIE